MGVELTFLPIDYFNEDLNYSYSHNVLDFGRNYPFFDELEKLKKVEVLDTFTSLVSRQEVYPGQPVEKIPEEEHYGITTTNPYGRKVTYVLAGDLKALFSSRDWTFSKRQRCAVAYISQLADSDKVALYFH